MLPFVFEPVWLREVRNAKAPHKRGIKRGAAGLEPAISHRGQSRRTSLKRYPVVDVCSNPAPATRKSPAPAGFFRGRARGSHDESNGGLMAESEQKVELEGQVTESFRSGMHRIALDNGHEALGYTSGRMRRYRIRINPGDRVKVELSPYDLTRGRIVYRER
jgi:translation initiation factor IF-1